MIDAAIQITPVTTPLVRWAEIRPGGLTHPPEKDHMAPTSFQRLAANDEFNKFFTKTHLLAGTPAKDLLMERVRPIGRPEFGKVEVADRNKVDEIAAQRVKLLAAKYAGGASMREIIARLEILNRRLVEMAPRVTAEQVSALEGVGDKLDAIQLKIRERAARLSLPS